MFSANTAGQCRAALLVRSSSAALAWRAATWADANIYHFGRNDLQIKIRGLRIEMGRWKRRLQPAKACAKGVRVMIILDLLQQLKAKNEGRRWSPLQTHSKSIMKSSLGTLPSLLTEFRVTQPRTYIGARDK
jgi:hypothetical protein